MEKLFHTLINWPTTVNPQFPIRSNEGLTHETSVFQIFHGGEPLSTPLIKANFHVFHSRTDATPQFL